MSDSYLELQDITFVYNEESIPVWQNLFCSFLPNTVNLLLGPSGCGKSSLLYLISGLIPHSLEGRLTGNIILKGESISGSEPRELASRIGLVFQDPDTQFCTFLVEDELAFGLENLCVPREMMDERIDRALTITGLSGLRKRKVTSLSGGQKQKLAIACALIMDAELLLLDEPTSMLDAAGRKEIVELLHRLVTQHGKTIILIEHNLDEVLPYASHAVVLDRGGKLALQGSAHDVFTRLTFDPTYAKLAVCLPEPLLILRDWLNAKDDAARKAFRAEQLQKRQDGVYAVPYRALAQLLKQSPHTSVCSIAAPPLPLPPTHPPLIEAHHVAFRYGEKRGTSGAPVLHGVDFSIAKGEFVAIAGPNGAGKTTLLNLLFRVLKLSEGSVSIAGQPLNALKTQMLYQQMGLLFQNPEWQFVTNCVADELAFSLKKSGMRDDEKLQAINRILKQFHLEKHHDKSPFLLSQGEKRRLSVACMLLTGQKTLFLDEPTFGQDLETSHELMQLLQSLRAEGVTIVIVTHDVSLVCRYTDRVLLLCDGSIAFDGPPAQLFSRPLLPQWRMEYPPARVFCNAVQQHLPDFPVLFRTQDCFSYLSALTTGGDSA